MLPTFDALSLFPISLSLFMMSCCVRLALCHGLTIDLYGRHAHIVTFKTNKQKKTCIVIKRLGDSLVRFVSRVQCKSADHVVPFVSVVPLIAMYSCTIIDCTTLSVLNFVEYLVYIRAFYIEANRLQKPQFHLGSRKRLHLCAVASCQGHPDRCIQINSLRRGLQFHPKMLLWVVIWHKL